MQLYDNSIDMDSDLLEYIQENDLIISDIDESAENPAWTLRESIIAPRPYTLSDFERKYFIPDL